MGWMLVLGSKHLRTVDNFLGFIQNLLPYFLSQSQENQKAHDAIEAIEVLTLR